MKTTRDGKHLVATGTYKPRMKVFDLEELSLKTERVTDSENVDFCVRSPSISLLYTSKLTELTSLRMFTFVYIDFIIRLDKNFTFTN